MFKKLISLFFATVIFLSGSAFSSADAFFVGSPKSENLVSCANPQNNIHFVKDYSKIINDVCKNFVNGISLLCSNNMKRGHENIKKTDYKHCAADMIFFSDTAEKKIKQGMSFLFYADIYNPINKNALFAVLIFMFILWYIGLLRLFNENSIFSYTRKL